MNRIIARKIVSENIVQFEISTSIPVNGILPGQYIILRMDQNETGFALPVIRTNVEKETITLMVSVTDDLTAQLASLRTGSTHFELKGPFGYGAHIENFGTVLCIGRGSGILLLLPVLKALRAAGNQVIAILSASSKEGIFLQNEISAVSDEVITITDDGTCGEKGSICQVAGQALKNNRIQHVFVIGSAKTIKQTCSLTTKYNIQTQAVLYMGNPIKNGSHGIFRVSNCGNVRSVCVDGYNFNGWYPNFDEMIKRFAEVDPQLQDKVNILNQTTVPV